MTAASNLDAPDAVRVASEISSPRVLLYGPDSACGGDCIVGMQTMLEPESVDHINTSIPFESLFQYSGKTEDIGNNPGSTELLHGRFALNMRWVVEGMHHVLKPGRIAAIHIQQLRATATQHGFIGRRDFISAVKGLFTGPRRIDRCPACLRAVSQRYPRCGWCGAELPHWEAGPPDQPYFEHVGEFVIPKNPQLVAKREQVHSLMFITGRRDSCRLAPTANDYVFLFRKPGDDPQPVRALYEPDTSVPHYNPDGWISTEDWIRDASGVWDDVQETDTLEGWRDAREKGDEKHVCPLQLTVIRRSAWLYTPPGGTVLDPFCGVGSVAPAVWGWTRRDARMTYEPRRILRTGEVLPLCDVVGFELKESYHRKALRFAAAALDGRLDREATRSQQMELAA